VSKRVTPSERLRAEVDEVFAGGADLATAIEQVARIGARLLLQTALEAEATEFLGRERYARAASCEDAREGSRNGYCQTTIKTTSGPVTLARPKLRNTTEAFASQLLGTGVTKTHALESLVIAGFVRAVDPGRRGHLGRVPRRGRHGVALDGVADLHRDSGRDGRLAAASS
jgi:putative transposase